MGAAFLFGALGTGLTFSSDGSGSPPDLLAGKSGTGPDLLAGKKVGAGLGALPGAPAGG